MNSNIIRSWNGRTIRQREDGYLSLTDMAQACDKLVGNWTRLSSSEEYLEALRSKRYSDVNNDVIEIIQGGLADQQGTFTYRLKTWTKLI